MLTTAQRPRLLTSTEPGWHAHIRAHGPLPPWPAAPSNRLLLEVEAAGLRGRGGGWFPTAAKMRAVMTASHNGGGPAVVVANAMESEPASLKDATLLAASPHLVLDGLVCAAQAVWAQEAILCLPQDNPAVPVVASALAERSSRGADPLPIRLVCPPHRYLSGEESALVQWLNGEEARPSMGKPYAAGVQGRPTLVQNVETLAQLALIVRHGAAWFRSAGTQAATGTTLVSVSGAVNRPGVVEIGVGTSIVEIVNRCEGVSAPVQAVLTGGYGGAWLPAALGELPWSPEDLAAHGGSAGAGVLVLLPGDSCGIAETARAVSYLAEQGAQQCGPCRFGLSALAAHMHEIAQPATSPFDQRGAAHLSSRIRGRGACRLPDGASRLVDTALEVFADELSAHRRGQCSGGRQVLPTPRRKGLA